MKDAFSLFILFSTGREKDLEKTLTFIKMMDQNLLCQITVISDGPCKIRDPFVRVHSLPRIDKDFCWADAINAGVCSAKSERLWYLDCDRILGRNTLTLANLLLSPGSMVYPHMHFHEVLRDDFSEDELSELANCDLSQRPIYAEPQYYSRLRFEKKFVHKMTDSGKTPVSGCLFFCKEDYLKLGGFDPFYKGEGAFADTDFHARCVDANIDYKTMPDMEIHLHHAKREIEQSNNGMFQLATENNKNYYLGKYFKEDFSSM